MYKAILGSFLLAGVMSFSASAQMPPVFGKEYAGKVRSDSLTHRYITPLRIIWQSDTSGTNIQHADRLLLPDNGQADLSNRNLCLLKNTGSEKAGILLDFGKELHGGIHITTGMMKVNKPVKVRIRFGESVSETMSDVSDTLHDATNDHAMRDFVVQLPWLGSLEMGNTGFRFVRIDLVDPDAELLLKNVTAVFTFRNLPYLGSFSCSDTLLNKIWMTGAYTVQLNMQDYLWDGIKRDRLVWVGDMGPEVATINTVFGYNGVVPKSLDLSRDVTPLPGWMNGISAYSMWWVLIQRDWYYHNGNKAYLQQQKDYLVKLLDYLIGKIGPDNTEKLDGTRFLDWPSSENPEAVHAGLQALMVMTLDAGADLCKYLNEPATAAKCRAAIARLKQAVPDPNHSKQAAALLALSGLMPADKADKTILSVGGAQHFSTFYGYYMLQAQAKAGNIRGALDNIRSYWGAMLNMGATTFWEDFNLDWTKNAFRIDELPIPGKKDIHGDYGAYCYKGFRHSLCHGWSSGPTSWLTEHVLGVKVVEPGCKAVRITPQLGDLEWAKGTFPTPYGLIRISCRKLPGGKTDTKITAPPGVRIIRS
ncbi:alpha-L-rhamnosidase C-terminal domain-containing protein [Compostibacter hankyongensis]|uniref:Alpha-L-rhamnosidase n=1 Tax=Compostibacter hankyongensis TaxID=1007089 RepID=A0ABP8G9J5_9BACT